MTKRTLLLIVYNRGPVCSDRTLKDVVAQKMFCLSHSSALLSVCVCEPPPRKSITRTLRKPIHNTDERELTRAAHALFKFEGRATKVSSSFFSKVAGFFYHFDLEAKSLRLHSRDFLSLFSLSIYSRALFVICLWAIIARLIPRYSSFSLSLTIVDLLILR